ncbi:MAG: phosphoribosylglycinamide formyltransferase [Candidatus Heimdallarchaeaceae archaeon]
MNVAVLISGRGSNLRAILEAEKANNLGNAQIKLVVSNNPNAKGLEHAHEFGKKVVILDSSRFKQREEYDKELVNILRENDIELVVLAGFMRILTKVFLDAYRNSVINIHPSLLPSFPGLHAQRQAIEYGVKIAGCTVHFVTEEVDGGPIILQKAVEVLDTDTEETLSHRILEHEHKLLPEAIRLISLGLVQIDGRKVRIVR